MNSPRGLLLIFLQSATPFGLLSENIGSQVLGKTYAQDLKTNVVIEDQNNTVSTITKPYQTRHQINGASGPESYRFEIIFYKNLFLPSITISVTTLCFTFSTRHYHAPIKINLQDLKKKYLKKGNADSDASYNQKIPLKPFFSGWQTTFIVDDFRHVIVLMRQGNEIGRIKKTKYTTQSYQFTYFLFYEGFGKRLAFPQPIIKEICFTTTTIPLYKEPECRNKKRYRASTFLQTRIPSHAGKKIQLDDLPCYRQCGVTRILVHALQITYCTQTAAAVKDYLKNCDTHSYSGDWNKVEFNPFFPCP